MPVGTVKSRIARGRHQLADRLGNRDPERATSKHRGRPHSRSATLRPAMTDDDILLASAYLDDDLDDAERAHAEADPT